MVRDMSKMISNAMPWFLVALTLTGCHIPESLAINSHEKTDLSPLTRRFVQSASEEERLALAIELINKSGVNRYSKLSEFDVLFGTKFDANRPSLERGQRDSVVLYMKRQELPKQGSVATSEDYEAGI